MRVALGILNKEIERLQVEIDFMPTIQSNPARHARLTAEIEELLEAWQVLKDWERPITYIDALRERVKENNDKYEYCRCVSTDPSDTTLCDKCPDNDKKPLHDPTTYTQRDSGIPLVNIATIIDP